jgi:hypothetical protein
VLHFQRKKARRADAGGRALLQAYFEAGAAAFPDWFDSDQT